MPEEVRATTVVRISFCAPSDEAPAKILVPLGLLADGETSSEMISAITAATFR